MRRAFPRSSLVPIFDFSCRIVFPGAKKKLKRDSMFKVPDGVDAKVGFTGSGQGMTEYPTRKRHDYDEAAPQPDA
jgi:hypothetical protein